MYSLTFGSPFHSGPRSALSRPCATHCVLIIVVVLTHMHCWDYVQYQDSDNYKDFHSKNTFKDQENDHRVCVWAQ